MEYKSYTEEDTFNIAKEIGTNAKAGDIFCLIGDLGVGKTIFSKGFAQGIGITDHITSPTFTIVQVYDNIHMPLYHFDMYRIEDSSELEYIGYEDYFFGDGICLVEWANNVEDVIPKNSIWIYIDKDLNQGFDYRQILVSERKLK
ncbi:tRNA (adenosine(37)-N6)-threonylcarbamoyltransferase complex ATPase subunit type 1 TsaE [Candidatus Epulonipiscium fishelsonii]|uniref:tRNA (Adenosine(37)-N6)-threonylcarbamoyltransferase complex ATPase subunit type 1 TsaE n=1 Tax=Candidatus Epulonipiscium fishelsonii TaxID=77094 RepID=A0ACC8X999_9FIRM|nr:tRNA (adenosine(37)-N6)-threonylcarbamoyltransferase complex ATPase subunit type 1 TsaE [Epulopiscium sp. SCG-B11WGA-EpuloA1]ONI39932.1 tRNA (adenosine(37)-N6)-threonylcarbamoyltransferase complex ATPase subunit type 1 TsaE [Epulopiscium sp. SCG-B05WGA-EpuloA1]